MELFEIVAQSFVVLFKHIRHTRNNKQENHAENFLTRLKKKKTKTLPKNQISQSQLDVNDLQDCVKFEKKIPKLKTVEEN